MDATPTPAKPALGLTFPEFIGLMALLMALTALSIDIMLPALPAITSELGAATENDRQLVVTSYLIGLGLGQLLWGPLSDRFGRRAPLLTGLALYAAGGLAACLASSFPMLLAARALQGIGGASARTIGTAVVRDTYQGRQMARIMSFVMTVFILVPVLAPAIGQTVMHVFGWRASFVVLFSAGATAFAWTLLRLPETLPESSGASGQPARHGLLAGIRIVLGSRITIGYGLASGFMFGCLVSYISSAQQVFVDHFQLGPYFPLAFGGIAGSMALAAMTNARLVTRLGMRRLSHTAISAFIVNGLLLVLTAFAKTPPLLVFAPLMAVAFFLFGLTMSNLTAIALQPAGKAAGLASSLIGAATTAMGVICGTLVGRSFDGTPRPLAIGFALLGVLAFLTILTVEGRRGLFRGE